MEAIAKTIVFFNTRSNWGQGCADHQDIPPLCIVQALANNCTTNEEFTSSIDILERKLHEVWGTQYSTLSDFNDRIYPGRDNLAYKQIMKLLKMEVIN